jgi:hypothetical protein
MPKQKPQIKPQLCLELNDWISARYYNGIYRRLDINGAQTDDPEQTVKYFVNIDKEHSHALGNIVIALVDRTQTAGRLRDMVRLTYNNELINQEHGDLSERIQQLIKELKAWATQGHLLGFEIVNPQVDPVKRWDTQKPTVAESKWSPLTGTIKTSVQRLDDNRLIIKHSENIVSEVRGARSRKIHKIYLENAQGERFLLPTTSLRGARAQLRHVQQGGNPYDATGQAITEATEEATQLSKFVRRTGKRVFEDQVAQQVVESAKLRVQEVKKLLDSLAGERGYKANVSKLQEAAIEFDESVKSHFVREQYDNRLDEGLPWAWRAYQMSQLTEVDQLARWADAIVNEQSPQDLENALKSVGGAKPPVTVDTEGGKSSFKVDADELKKPATQVMLQKIQGKLGNNPMPVKVTEMTTHKEIVLTHTDGRTQTVSVPANMDAAHLADVMSNLSKKYPGVTMEYYEDGQLVDEAIGGDASDRLIRDTVDDSELDEMKKLSGLDTVDEAYDEDMEEGNAFTGALDAARDAGKDEFTVGGKKFKVSESDDLAAIKKLSGL